MCGEPPSVGVHGWCCCVDALRFSDSMSLGRTVPILRERMDAECFCMGDTMGEEGEFW